MQLLIILLGLGVALIVVVNLAERFGKPMDAVKQNKLSRIIVVLVFVLLVVQIILFALRGG